MEKNTQNSRIKGDWERGLQRLTSLISSDVRPMHGSGRVDLTPWMMNAPVGDINLSAGAPPRDLNRLLAFPWVLNQADSSCLSVLSQNREP